MKSAGRRHVVVLFLLLAGFTEGSAGGVDSTAVDPGADRWSVLTLLRYQENLRRNIGTRDVCKLLFQAAFGVEHLLTDSVAAREYLMAEIAQLDSTSGGGPLLERISPDGKQVRLNLGPFKALNLPPGMLVKAMFASAAETRADTALFFRWWSEYLALVRYGLLAVPADLPEWTRVLEEGFPGPVHHSEEYVRANRPAYRVLRRDVILPMLNTLGNP